MKNRKIKEWIRKGLFILAFSMLLGAAAWSSSSGSTLLCLKCHVMKPQAMTWSESLHRNIPCATCHINPTYTDRLSFSLSLIPKAYQTFTRSYRLPIHSGNSVRNEVCLQCHTPNRTVTPRNDLSVPHDQHFLNGVFCINCHTGVAHGQIDERNQTIDGNFNKWTPEFAKQEMALENLIIGMKECMECHQTKERGPLQCTGCHEKMITPQSHKNKAWMQQHGKEALQNVVICEKCHNYTNIERKPLKAEDKDAAIYARKNTFCLNCHLRLTSPHEEGWAFSHCFTVNREDATRCLICHEMNQPKADADSQFYCSKCHEKNLGPAW